MKVAFAGLGVMGYPMAGFLTGASRECRFDSDPRYQIFKGFNAIESGDLR